MNHVFGLRSSAVVDAVVPMPEVLIEARRGHRRRLTTLLAGTALTMAAWQGTAHASGASACDTVSGNLVTNCGFETGAPTTSTVQAPTGWAVTATSMSQTGYWVVSNGNGSIIHSGNAAYDLYQGIGINQQVVTTSGATYTLTFYIYDLSGTTPLNVLFGSSTATVSGSQSGYQLETLTFTASSNSTMLGFINPSTQRVIIIDDIALFLSQSPALVTSSGGVIDTSKGSFAFGDSAASGSTATFNGGKLTNASSASSATNFIITGKGGTIDAAGNTLVFTGTISNDSGSTPGYLVISNSGNGGTVVLAPTGGTNTFSGGITVQSGATLQIASGGALGTGTLALVGSATMPAGLSVTGDTTITNGITLANDPTITVAAGTTTRITGNITDGTAPGDLLVNGGGTLALDGVNTYTGATTVAAGTTLAGNGSIASPTTIYGTLSPGDSLGNLTFSAPVVQADGSRLQINIAGANTYSNVAVIGASYTAAGTLAPVLAAGYTPALGTIYNVVQASGGVLGSFSSLAQPNGLAAGTRVDALYGPNNLGLVITPASYANLAAVGLNESAIEAQIGAVVDANRPAAGVRGNAAQSAFYNALYLLPSQLIAPALNEANPSIYGDGLLSGRNAWYDFSSSVADQMAQRRNGIDGANTRPGPHGSTIWFSGMGQFNSIANNNGTDGFSSHMAGAMAGIDYPVAPGTRAGIAIGGGSISTGSNGATDTSNDVQVSVYGTASRGRIFVDGQASYMHVDRDIHRQLALFGASVSGGGQMQGGGGQVNAGLHLKAGRFRIEPTIGLSALSLTAGGVTESSGGIMAEHISSQSIASVSSFAGARLATSLALRPNLPLELNGKLGWQHEFAATTANTNASLSQVSDTNFQVSSAPISRNTAVVGVGAALPVSSKVSIFAAYDAGMGDHSTSQYINGGVRVTW